MTIKRSKNLSDGDIAEIVAILDGWSGKLSWELFIEAIAKRKHTSYTRQTLHKHVRIREAFSLRKKTLSNAPESSVSEDDVPPELRAALEYTARLQAENTRLKMENARLLEQFVLWAYNAHTHGLDHDFLARPIPKVSRGQSDARRS